MRLFLLPEHLLVHVICDVDFIDMEPPALITTTVGSRTQNFSPNVTYGQKVHNAANEFIMHHLHKYV